VGAGADLEEARRALFLERKGWRIAVLAFAENEFGMATEAAAGANPLNPLRNLEDIRRASAQADLTLVLVHGGNEYNPVPSPRMRQTYRAFAEAGATAVVGGHTHCPQGFEIWRGVPVVYSLGNFLFDARPEREPLEPPAWWHGYMVRLGLAGKRAWRLELVPHSCYPAAEAVAPLVGRERRGFLRYLLRLGDVARDPRESLRFWEAWCAREDSGYVERLLGKTSNAVSPPAQELLDLRNLFTCESHSELLATYLRLACEGRLEEARRSLPELLRLMGGEVVA
jgi:poly-gamma-glutamate synthesis protein (capsule biosynthesis protein)